MPIDPVRRHLQDHVVGNLVHPVRRLLLVIQGRQRPVAGEDDDQVVRVHLLEAGGRLKVVHGVHRRPGDVPDRDRLAPVQDVEQPPIELHQPDQPPFVGEGVERDARAHAT